METSITKIYFVRHAKSEANHAKKYTGWLDTDLSNDGIAQAEKGQRYFADISVDNIYSSPLKRAYKTAKIVFGDTAVIKKMDDFKELNVGLFEMKTYEEVLSEYPEILRKWIDDPTTATPPEGENLYDFYKRVTTGFVKVVNENIGKTAVIVTHGGVIRSLILYALNMKLNDIWRIKVNNMSVSIIELMGGNKTLALLNDTCHLDEETL